MIKLFKKNPLILLLGLVMVMMHACIHDDFEEPPLSEIPVGTVLTVSELLDLFQGDPVVFTDDYSVFATVTMDDKSGNIYRSAFVADHTGAVNLRLQAPGGIYQGDSVRIYLKGTTLGMYQQMMQLDNVNVDRNIVKIATNVEVEPGVITIPEITSAHQAHLIRLEDVQFVANEVGLPFADSENLLSMNRLLEDCSGNRIVVRTSGYANFADIPVPEGRGSLIAIVAQYGGTLQLYIRSINELSMDDERCPVPGDDYDLITIKELRENYLDGVTSIPPNTRIEGVVISDREHSNHPSQNLFMMDDSGQGIVIRFAGSHNFEMGTLLRVIVSNMVVSEFNGLMQIDNTPIGNAWDLGTSELPEPRVATIQEIKDNITTYQSTLVRIHGVTFSGGSTFAGSINITDATGSMPVFTHAWASFANSQVPTQTVTLTGIASIHFDPQLMIRSLNDIVEE